MGSVVILDKIVCGEGSRELVSNVGTEHLETRRVVIYLLGICNLLHMIKLTYFLEKLKPRKSRVPERYFINIEKQRKSKKSRLSGVLRK